MHDSNPTCICLIINPAYNVVGAEHDITRLTKKNMSSFSLNFSTNSTEETQNPWRDTSNPSISSGLSKASQPKGQSQSSTQNFVPSKEKVL